MRVPLIDPVTAVIYRLDIASSWAVDPPGDMSEGYDPYLDEPVVSVSGDTRTVVREELAPVSVPCQFETTAFERLQATFPGNDEVTDIVLVLHRQDLESLSLLDANNKCVFKPGDRIDHIEKNGTTVLTFNKPLYVFQVMPRSWGFGTTGYDHELLYTTYRAANP